MGLPDFSKDIAVFQRELVEMRKQCAELPAIRSLLEQLLEIEKAKNDS